MSFINLNLGHPVVRESETTTGRFGALGMRFVMDGADAGGRFGLVEHPIAPRGLAAPLHLHTREDEYSFVLEGRWGFQLGDEVVYAEPGDLVFKPRDVWHTFCNASDEPARLLEVISPSGFEHFFTEVSAIFEEHGMDRMDLIGKAAADYGLQLDAESIPDLLISHGLTMG
jgi:mannose-6-phosphate isomerase-like protein (cupin superfamily)